MANQRNELQFDILSYPLSSTPSDHPILVDVAGVGSEFAEQYETVLHVDSERESADRYRAALERNGGTPLEKAMAIVDQEHRAELALAEGMGVTLIADCQGLADSLRLLQQPTPSVPHQLYKQNPLYGELSIEEVADALYEPGKINIVGFIGRTGAGKSTTIGRLVDSLGARGRQAALFEVDAFFKRSRSDRKQWLNEPDISEAERAERQRVVTWWDLGRAAATLTQLQNGEPVHLTDLYDMRRGGELVGTMDIEPSGKGSTIFVEGTALLVPELSDAIGSFVYFNTHDQVRAQLLMKRNTEDGYSPDESHKRKILTDAAETNEHIARHLRVARYLLGNLTVLDNTSRNDHLKIMPPYIPKK